MRHLPEALVSIALFGSMACAPPAPGTPPLPTAQEQYWSALQALCGQAFEGELVERIPPDDVFTGRHLVMHVRECRPDEVRVPFHVGENRSRTWVLTRTADGIRLKHDHRHDDGSPEDLTWYGGETDGPGTADRQEFPADAETAAMLPAAATNVWTVDIRPGDIFAYALRREGAVNRLRIEFDLTRPVTPPPPPWGF